jgi:hypothetical protein
MTFGSHPRRIAAALATVVAVSGCGAVAVATPHAAAPSTTATPSTAQAATAQAPTTKPSTAKAPTAIDHLTTVARRQYSLEIHGGAAFGALHKVGRDAGLLRTLQSGNASALRAYVQRQFAGVWYHLHVSRMRIVQGSRVVVETGVPFVVAPVHMTLHGHGGRTLGTLQVSIQDEIGFVRLMHRHYPIDVVVRGQRAGDVRTSLPVAAPANLPSSGSVTIAGQHYLVRSFHQTAWNNEPVTISILKKG